MRLFYYAQISLLWIGWVLSASIDTNNNGVTMDDNFPFTSVIDILSQNVEFSTFLRIIQKNGFIPYLNELQNYTLLAPVNSAFIYNESADRNDLEKFDIENYLIHDSVLLSFEINNGISLISEGVKFPYILERFSDDAIMVNGIKLVDPDLLPNFQNASVHGIEGKIHTPLNLKDLLQKGEEWSNNFHLFNKFIRNIPMIDSMVTNNTILIPTDVNWHKYFSPIEIDYITDAFDSLERIDGDTKDIWSTDRKIFTQNIIIDRVLGGIIPHEVDVANLNGVPLNLQSENHGSFLKVNGTNSSDLSNIVFNRGLAHSFDDLQIIKNIISFTAEKYLHGINCSDFVRELYFRNLQYLIRDPKEFHDKEKTIFVPDVPTAQYDGFSRPGLLYHFVDKRIWLDQDFVETDLHQTKMFQSKFCDPNNKLGGNCQRLKILKNEHGYYINDKYQVVNNQPFQVGYTLIYLISDKIRLPGDLASSINPFYGCSRSLMFMNQLNILNLPSNKEGYTVLLPCFDSWEFLELNLEFLQKNMTAINSIMKSLIFEGLIYSDSNSIIYGTKNLLDDRVVVETERSYSNGDDKGLNLKLSGISTKIEIKNHLDLFFNQGVIHPLKNLYLPDTVNVSLIDLIHTAGTGKFIELFEKFEDLFSIINNNEPYSLLVPTESSLSLVGDIFNSTKLSDLLKLHIITGNLTTKLLNCQGNVTTLLGDSLICRRDSQNNSFLSVLDGSSNEVRITKKGCSYHNSCVFLIDRPISLQWLNRGKNWLKLPKSPLGIAISIETLILLFGLSFILYKKEKNETRLNPTFTNNDVSDIREPLLQSNERIDSNDEHDES